ncbi:SDR family NAD(P)-dependent oxidoreductase [Oerskovia sp. M15]
MWRTIIDVNLTGTFLGIHAVSPIMAQARSGSIINISSVEGCAAARACTVTSPRSSASAGSPSPWPWTSARRACA